MRINLSVTRTTPALHHKTMYAVSVVINTCIYIRNHVCMCANMKMTNWATIYTCIPYMHVETHHAHLGQHLEHFIHEIQTQLSALNHAMNVLDMHVCIQSSIYTYISCEHVCAYIFHIHTYTHILAQMHTRSVPSIKSIRSCRPRNMQ